MATTHGRIRPPEPVPPLGINTLPGEAYNTVAVFLVLGYGWWVVVSFLRLYRCWRIINREGCVKQGRVVLIEGLGYRVQVSLSGWVGGWVDE